MKQRRPYLLDGPVLLGFAELFDYAYGDASTPKPYATIAPARVGDALAPFPCPRCEAVQGVDERTRRAYRDPRRGHSWCTTCGLRYFFDKSGSLGSPTVTRNGEVLQIPRREDDVFALIGAEA